MLNRRLIPSSLGEAEYLTDGTFAVSVPGSGVQTNTQLVPLPPGESAIRYPAIRPDGQIAGQPQNTVRGAWIWNNASGWSTDPRIPASPNPVIYDMNGLLHVNELGPGYVGSQGFRYVNPSNQVISGDATYAARNGVAEWIDLSLGQDGSLLVGYAVWTLACIIWDGTHHRLLNSGNAKRLKAHRTGDRIAIAICTDSGGLLIDGTVADLLELPIFEPAPEPQPPEPIPPEPQPPEPPQPIPPQPVPHGFISPAVYHVKG